MYNSFHRQRFASHNWPNRLQWTRDKIAAPHPCTQTSTQHISWLKKLLLLRCTPLHVRHRYSQHSCHTVPLLPTRCPGRHWQSILVEKGEMLDLSRDQEHARCNSLKGRRIVDHMFCNQTVQSQTPIKHRGQLIVQAWILFLSSPNATWMTLVMTGNVTLVCIVTRGQHAYSV